MVLFVLYPSSSLLQCHSTVYYTQAGVFKYYTEDRKANKTPIVVKNINLSFVYFIKLELAEHKTKYEDISLTAPGLIQHHQQH